MITIYHNPRCRKSRAGLALLQEMKVEHIVVDHIRNPLSPGEIDVLLQKLNIRAEDLVRSQEELYRKTLKGRRFNHEEWLHILSENPRLIRRPIIVREHRAVIADPPENALPLLQ